MRIPGRRYLRRVIRPWVRTFFPGAVVLGYHRVAFATWDPFRLSVTPEHFSEQLGVIAGLREIISLTELAERHTAGERLDSYAVLTFDDGYADFAETVIPLATGAGVPVTVFVATGYTGHHFWWEEVCAILEQGGQKSSTLELKFADAEPMRFVGLERIETRFAAAETIGDRLVGRPNDEIDAMIDRLRDWAGVMPSPAGRPMTQHELVAVANTPGVEVGAHTVSHNCLAKLTGEMQRQEIGLSKARLETICGTEVKVFSYPHGSLSAETASLVRSTGYSCACASHDGVFTARDDPFRIPRLWAPDVGGAEFRHWLGAWVAGAQ